MRVARYGRADRCSVITDGERSADRRLQPHHLSRSSAHGGELMRGVLLSIVCAAGLLAAAPATPTASTLPAAPAVAAVSAHAPVFALQQADKTIDININGGGHWYRSPVWIAIGAIAIVVILLLVIVAARGGGGTTIVKE